MQLRSAAVNEISRTETRFNPFNIAQFLQTSSVLIWVKNLIVHFVYTFGIKLCIKLYIKECIICVQFSKLC